MLSKPSRTSARSTTAAISNLPRWNAPSLDTCRAPDPTPWYVPPMAVTHVFAGIPVAHRDAAVGWYERLVGRPPDLVPNDDEAAWRLTETGWMYVVADPGRVGSALHTLLVDDLDA